MLLFSTVLQINDLLTEEIFIQNVIEWNQNSPHQENIIPGIVRMDRRVSGLVPTWCGWISQNMTKRKLLLSAMRRLRRMV